MHSDTENIIISIVGKRNTDSCYVNLSNGESILCNIDLVAKYYLSKGKAMSEELHNQIVADQRLIEVKKAAYRFATYKPRTRHQIADKLKIKGFEKREIDYGIEFLMQLGIVYDAKYAMDFVRNKTKLKSYGVTRIKIELRKAGVRDELIESAVLAEYPSENALELAIQAGTKKLRMLQNKPIDKQKNSMTQFLVRQGFLWDIIKKANSILFAE